jgi:hypothetical protein
MSVRLRNSSMMTTASRSSANSAFTLIEVTVLTGILGLLLTLAVPNFVKSREDAQRQLCIHNLNQIDAAKLNWAMKSGMGSGEEPYEDELAPFFANQRMPLCPAGGEYDFGPVSEPALCSLVDDGHLSEAGLDAYEEEPPATVAEPKKPKKAKPGRRRHH